MGAVSTARARPPQAGPQPGHPAAAAGGGRRLPGRARLDGQHGLGGRRARRRLPGCGPAPLPDPRGPVHRGRRVCRRGALRGAAAAAGRRAAAAAVGRGALVALYTGPLFRAALQLWVAASNEAQLGPRVTELEARVGRETHRMAVELLGVDESGPACARRCRACSTWHVAWGWPTCSRTTARAGNGWSRSGPRCWTRRWADGAASRPAGGAVGGSGRGPAGARGRSSPSGPRGRRRTWPGSAARSLLRHGPVIAVYLPICAL